MAAAPVVVKFGSALIVDAAGEPRREVVAAAAADIADAPCRGTTGLRRLVGRDRAGPRRRRHRRRRAGLPQLQAASALGQAKLQALWNDACTRTASTRRRCC